MPMELLNWPMDICHHLDNTLQHRNPGWQKINRKKQLARGSNWHGESMSKRYVCYLSFNAFSATWEAEFVMIHRWTLYEMCIFESFLTQCTFQCWIWCRRWTSWCSVIAYVIWKRAIPIGCYCVWFHLCGKFAGELVKGVQTCGWSKFRLRWWCTWSRIWCIAYRYWNTTR